MQKLKDAAFSLFLLVFIPFGAAITFVGLPLAYVSLIAFPVIGLSSLLDTKLYLAFLLWWCQLAPLFLAKIVGSGFLALLMLAISVNAWLYYKGVQATGHFLAVCNLP